MAMKGKIHGDNIYIFLLLLLLRREYEELTRGQLLLQDLVERHGIPVFNDIQTALECTAKVMRLEFSVMNMHFISNS